MYMSVIQSVRICRKRKSGFLGRNCDVWGFFGVIFFFLKILLKAYFIPQIPFLWQQNLKGSVFLAVSPCFNECGFDGIGERFPVSSHFFLSFSPATKYSVI